MSVGIIYSSTNGGTAISDLNHGSGSNDSTLSAQTIYLRHDGTYSITATKLYIRALTTTYSGAVTPATDLAEVLSWGDGTTTLTFGGFQTNMYATTGFPEGMWPTFTTRQRTAAHTHRTGVGDSSTNAYTLPIESGATVAGEVQAGGAPNVRLQCRMVIPASAITTGKRQFELAILYTYTS